MRKNLKEARQATGMTQQQMADKLDATEVVLIEYNKYRGEARYKSFYIILSNLAMACMEKVFAVLDIKPGLVEKE